MNARATQDPAEYSQQRALELRHDWHFSRLFLPPSSRNAFGALLALRAELAEQLRDVSEPAIGMAKLEWWRSEIERGFQRSAQHPLAIHLGDTLREKGVAVEYVLEQVDAAEMAFLPDGVATPADQKLFRYRRDGVLAEIAVRLSCDEYTSNTTTTNERELFAAARAIGELRAHADSVISLAAQVRSGFTVVASEKFPEHGMAIEGSPDRKSLDALIAVEWQLWDQLRTTARTAMEGIALPPALMVQWRLLEADHKALVGNRGSLATGRISLPGPLRRLFIAWRAALAARAAAKRTFSNTKGY